jgi:hypothetical protein
MVEVLSAEREGSFWSGVESATRFFRGEADVPRALERLARTLGDKNIPYAIIGGMALGEWGYRCCSWCKPLQTDVSCVK